MEKEKYTVLELMGEFDYPPEILVKPKVWNKTIVNEKGKTQRLAMDLLADLVYWHKPAKGNATNPKGKKKFHGAKYQKTIAEWADEFNEGVHTIRRAIRFLDNDLHVIKRSTENVKGKNGRISSNVLYIEIDVRVLLELTYPSGVPAELTKLFTRSSMLSDENKREKTHRVDKIVYMDSGIAE